MNIHYSSQLTEKRQYIQQLILLIFECNTPCFQKKKIDPSTKILELKLWSFADIRGQNSYFEQNTWYLYHRRWSLIGALYRSPGGHLIGWSLSKSLWSNLLPQLLKDCRRTWYVWWASSLYILIISLFTWGLVTVSRVMCPSAFSLIGSMNSVHITCGFFET